MEVINSTPYAMERVVIFDKQGNETLLVAIKATYDFFPGTTQLAAVQTPIVHADEYLGDELTTSIRVASDLLPTRPTTGVTVFGNAVSTEGPVTSMQVGVRVGDLTRLAIVKGDRLGFGQINHPQPFETLPLIWENSFGGFDSSNSNPSKHDALQDNPIGKGFVASASKLSLDEIPLPNIEDPDALLEGARRGGRAVGFGPIPPAWLARRQYAGTYDDHWQKERMPLLPEDFDDRFLQCAPATLTASQYLSGKESITLLGMTEEGKLSFDLNAAPPTIGLTFHKTGRLSQPSLESIHIDAKARNVQLTWKSAINIQGHIESLKTIEARVL